MYNQKKVLVVQDDAKVNKIISQCLKPNYIVTFQNNISIVFDLLEKKHFDLLIINTKIKSGSGVELCRRVKMETTSKVIFLSNTNNVDLKEKCFELGADDFVTMPFYPKELHIRIKKILNEYSEQLKDAIIKNGYTLHIKTRCLELDKCSVYLSPTEFVLLEYLVSQNGFKKREHILKYINTRKNSTVRPKTILVLINRLRHKLHKATGMEIIKTRYGLGYCISI